MFDSEYVVKICMDNLLKTNLASPLPLTWCKYICLFLIAKIFLKVFLKNSMTIFTDHHAGNYSINISKLDYDDIKYKHSEYFFR